MKANILSLHNDNLNHILTQYTAAAYHKIQRPTASMPFGLLPAGINFKGRCVPAKP